MSIKKNYRFPNRRGLLLRKWREWIGNVVKRYPYKKKININQHKSTERSY